MMNRLLFLCAALAAPGFAIDNSSQYLSLNSDYLVTTNSGVGQIVLQTTLTLNEVANVLFVSDGRFYPYLQNGLATVEIRLDGNRVTNISALDFRGTHPVQHSFNCIGTSWVTPGSHSVSLVAYNHPSVSGGQFYVGSGSNLSIVVSPASEMSLGAMGADSNNVNVTTLNNTNPLPYSSVLSVNHVASSSPVVVLTSGRSYAQPYGAYGDAMWGTYLNGACPANSEQMWTINDLVTPTGELHAPMYGHARYETSGSVTLRIAATEEPYDSSGTPPWENPVQYKVGSTSTIVGLSGDIPINGGVSLIAGTCAPNSFFGVQTGQSTPWSSSFSVAPGQNGNVMLMLKTRVLDCAASSGPSAIRLRIRLDGIPVGSTAIQEFEHGETCHQRTLTASYLALGLSPGTHSVSGTFDVSGMAWGLAASGDLALMWFGN